MTDMKPGLPFLCALAIGAAAGAELAAAGPDAQLLFERDVLPILRKHCLKCHGANVRKGELDLSTLGGVLRGGESGEPAVLRGQSQQSHLIELVQSGDMPPDTSRLTDRQINVIREWIDGGAAGTSAGEQAALTPELLQARRVKFLLEVKCIPCHGRAEQQGELDLRTITAALKGGKSGPALVRGKADESLIVRRIKDDQMPPREARYKRSIKPVDEGDLELIRRWIDGGAIDPPPPPGVVHDDGLLVTNDDRNWWAFRRPKADPLPSVLKADRVRTPIDVFLLTQLEAHGLGLSPDADRRTLIRRLEINLTGLVPSSADVQAFVNNRSPDAFERRIDRLLASPHCGERWGQHWLDAAGYTDSEESWEYRDYVVRSLNSDKPYDRFLVEQIAGDELADYHSAPRMTRELQDNLIATGFLRTCIDPTTDPERNFLYDRYQVLADTVEIVSSSLMGLTLRCARCHSHKYDPLPMRDYYRFTAIFASAYSPYEWVKPKDRFLELAGTEDRSRIAEHNARIDKRIQPVHEQLDRLTKAFRAKFIENQLAELPETERERVGRALDSAVDTRTDEQELLLAGFGKRLQPDQEMLAESFAEFRKRSEELNTRLTQLAQQRRQVPVAHGLRDMRAQADPFYLLKRGEWDKRGRRVLPGVPAALQDSWQPFRVSAPDAGIRSSGNRLSLARWLTRPDNRLTVRVLVNRVWQHHFGTGIVRTPDDFGRTGAPPTHPRLLDWLAVEFMNRGWRLKDLHRLIVTSTVWRQQSRVRPDGAAGDPDNRLLWRMPLRRMDAETLRDSLLSVTGELNRQMAGPPAAVSSISDGQIVANDSAAGHRRSIYLPHRRSQPLTVLETFDLPRMTTNCVKRRTSNVVSQALLMLNSRFADRRAERIAARVAAAVPDDRRRQIESATRIVLGRAPTDAEAKLAINFLRVQSDGYGGAKPLAPAPGIHGAVGERTPERFADVDGALVDYCLILLNSAEFLYVD